MNPEHYQNKMINSYQHNVESNLFNKNFSDPLKNWERISALPAVPDESEMVETLESCIQEVTCADPTASLNGLLELDQQLKKLKTLTRTGPERMFDQAVTAYHNGHQALTRALMDPAVRALMLIHASSLALGDSDSPSPALRLALTEAANRIAGLGEMALTENLALKGLYDPFLALLARTWLARTSGTGSTYELVPTPVLLALNSDHLVRAQYADVIFGQITSDELDLVRGLGEADDRTFGSLDALLNAARAL